MILSLLLGLNGIWLLQHCSQSVQCKGKGYTWPDNLNRDMNVIKPTKTNVPQAKTLLVLILLLKVPPAIFQYKKWWFLSPLPGFKWDQVHFHGNMRCSCLKSLTEGCNVWLLCMAWLMTSHTAVGISLHCRPLSKWNRKRNILLIGWVLLYNLAFQIFNKSL